MLKTTALSLALLIAIATASAAAPVKARIAGGIGILLLNKLSSEEQSAIIIYKEPALGRITATEAERFPPLSPSISAPEGFVPVIVTSKKSGWYRIIYDDGEREGWIEGRSAYQFSKWEELLRNRPVALLGGLRKEFYLLRRTADSNSEPIETLEKGSRISSLFMDGDWIMAMTDAKRQGWLRWRDENGRLVIALDPLNKKHF